jgi:hypothetical protein
MTWVARENLRSVDRLLAQPDPAATLRIKMLGRGEARLLLRYQASEQNRYYFELWEIVQIVLGGLFFFFLLFGTTEGKVPLALALVLVVLVATQRFLLTPDLTATGRLLDFGNPAGMLGERARFRVTHAAYDAIELGKWALQLVLAAFLIGRGRVRSGHSRQQFHMVDKADYRHIDW